MIKKIKKNPYTEVYTLGQHISMSAYKARRILDQIRERSYEETLMILELMPYRTCYSIFKLIYSAVTNANHNMNFHETCFVISKAEVNEGTNIKKLKPRARGRNYLIKRPTCHITIVLKNIALDKLYEEYEDYNISLKKSRWKKKKKSTDTTFHNMYSTGGLWDKK